MDILTIAQAISAHGTEPIFTTHGIYIMPVLTTLVVSYMITHTEDTTVLLDIRMRITELIIIEVTGIT